MKNDLKIFTDNIEPEAVNQIYELIRLAPLKLRVIPSEAEGERCDRRQWCCRAQRIFQ